jgi:hypothetical protein
MDEQVVEVVELVELAPEQLPEVAGGAAQPDPIIIDN